MPKAARTVPVVQEPSGVALPLALSMAIVVAIVVVVSIVGLSKTGVAPTSLATKSTALRPGYPAKLTEAVAKSETEHYAKVIGALIPKTDVASVVDEDELVPSDGSSRPHYEVISTITLVPRANAMEDAAAITTKLVAAGWIAHETSTESNQYLAALASTRNKTTRWSLEVGANNTTGQPATVTIQIGSPDLPKT